MCPNELTPEMRDLIRSAVETTLSAMPPTVWDAFTSNFTQEVRAMIRDNTVSEAVTQIMPWPLFREAFDRVCQEMRLAVGMAVDREMLPIRMHLNRISAVLMEDVPTDC
jgi:hypothetical protein